MTVRKDEFARRRRQLMKMMGKGAIAILPAAPEQQRNNDVHYSLPARQRLLLPHRLRRARGGRGADARPAAGGVHPVRARSRPGARDLGRQARRARGRGARLRRRRCVPDRRHRRHPARPARELRPRVLHDGRAPGVRPARDRLGERPARAGAQHGIHTPQEFVALDHLLHDMRLFKSRAELDRDAPRRRRSRSARTCARCAPRARASSNTR